MKDAGDLLTVLAYDTLQLSWLFLAAAFVFRLNGMVPASLRKFALFSV